MTDQLKIQDAIVGRLNNSIRVMLIEDIREVRESLRLLIDGTAPFRCVGTYASMEDALSRTSDEPPDVILTDIGLPGMSGIEGIGLLRERYSGVPIIALTVYADNGNVFNALCAGASGYLLKNTPPSRLLESINEVAAGGSPMSPEIARRVVELFREFHPPDNDHCRLTPQETELLKLLVKGHYYKTAALQMGISTSTVSFHLKNIYQKLQVHSKTEAVAKALRQRLV